MDRWQHLTVYGDSTVSVFHCFVDRWQHLTVFGEGNTREVKRWQYLMIEDLVMVRGNKLVFDVSAF